MGYKQMDRNMTFAEVSLLTSMEHNRSLKRLEKINQAIDWSEVEAVISAHYTVGTGNEGADAYPPKWITFPRPFLDQFITTRNNCVLPIIEGTKI